MMAFEIYSETPGIQQNNLWPQYFDIALYVVPSRDAYSAD
jgi:hypothetical protein